MSYRYPLLPDDMHLQYMIIPVYLDICDTLVNTPEKTFIPYEEIFRVASDRLAGPTVKDLLRRMDHAGVIRRWKNGKGRFAPFTKVYLTPAGRHWLTYAG